MQNNQHIRGLALLTGSVLAASALLVPAPAKADKADALKIGASVLGAAAVVLGVKGKTVPAVIAGAVGAYAYKKGRDQDRKNNNDPYYGQAGQYPQYPGNNYPTSGTYPPANNYPTYGSPTYGSNYPTTNYPTTNYPSNNYPTYNQPTTYSNYPSGGYGGNNSGNNNCHDGNRNDYNGSYNGNSNGNYNGSYNNGSDRYPSYRAVAPQSAARAPRSNQGYSNQPVYNQRAGRVVLR